MSVLSQPYKCDATGCDQVRQSDANHWWLVWLSRTPERFHSRDLHDFRIYIQPWDDGMAVQPFVGHYCGIEHAMAAIAKDAQKVLDEITRLKSKEAPDVA